MMERETAVNLATTLAAQMRPRAAEADTAAELPKEDVVALRESGYLGLTVPKEYGGAGLSMHDALAAHVALSQGSASTALVAGMQMHIFGNQREVKTWRTEKFAQFCQAAVEAGAMFNFIASEPKMGSPSRGGLPETMLTRNGSGWLLNGHKTWSTGGEHLTHMLVRTTIGDTAGVVLVKQGSAGLRWEPTWKTAMSLRASDSHDVYFENVQLTDDDIIEQGAPKGKGGPNVWFPMVMSAIYLGSAIAARNTVIQYALERVPSALGKPIATLPKIQRQIGELDVALQAAQAFFFTVAKEWTGDGDRQAFLPRIAAAKTMVTNTANMVTDKALQIAGGSSITGALPLDRFFRDVRAGSMQPPSGDTALEMVGRAALNGG